LSHDSQDFDLALCLEAIDQFEHDTFLQVGPPQGPSQQYVTVWSSVQLRIAGADSADHPRIPCHLPAAACALQGCVDSAAASELRRLGFIA
jgi:hypothetical protein